MTANTMFALFYTEQVKNKTEDGDLWKYKDDIENILIQFAKYHVEKALSEASEKATTNSSVFENCLVNKESILTAYNLENIK